MNDVLSLTMRRHGLVVVDSDDDLVVDFGQQYCNIDSPAVECGFVVVVVLFVCPLHVWAV